MSIKKELNHKMYMQREENIKHIALDNEFSIYHAIASGDYETIKICRDKYNEVTSRETNAESNGILSDDPLTNAKYHFVIFVAMVARICAQGGLNHETAYSLSDIFIKRMDKCTDIKSINALNDEVIYTYADNMRDLKKHNIYSKHIVKCIDYIADNLNAEISVANIAEYLNINPTYLSKLFVKETGTTLSKYIKTERLRAAANMLQFSDYSIGEISEYFCFSSQSHFTNAFQEEYTITPKKFRDVHAKKTIVVV